VLVVEDSLTVRKYFVEALNADPGFEVVAEAEDGQQAIELCTSLRPDVISMDMMLPAMTGLAATENIMAYCPTPILVVSASLNRGEVFQTYEALNACAVDVLEKPTGELVEDWIEEYKKALRIVSRIKVITHPRARLELQPARKAQIDPDVGKSGPFQCVAIGASTGGPAAIAEILRGLPANFPLPILLVVHISSAFGAAMSDWLDTLSPIRVVTAIDGQGMPQMGQPGVVVAPPDRHLVLRAGRLHTTSDPERNYVRPSVDVMFESLAHECGSQVIGCLLTGMGRDGAAGLLALRRSGAMTIAQDEQICAIFGMPREAIKLRAARHVAGLREIAPLLVALTASSANRE
jgi:two-component system, chemotaxis family, protein-glutamate methylesterase/glutaminase